MKTCTHKIEISLPLQKAHAAAEESNELVNGSLPPAFMAQNGHYGPSAGTAQSDVSRTKRPSVLQLGDNATVNGNFSSNLSSKPVLARYNLDNTHSVETNTTAKAENHTAQESGHESEDVARKVQTVEKLQTSFVNGGPATSPVPGPPPPPPPPPPPEVPTPSSWRNSLIRR